MTRFKLKIATCALLVLAAGCSAPIQKPAPQPAPVETPREQALNTLQQDFGKDARSRVESWHRLINENQNQSTTHKLTQANQFINQLEFVDDTIHWGQRDYWATPIETLSTNGGDCEDFSIAKYFTLKKMGIPDACMRLVYVKAQTINKAHMVLTHQCTPSDPVLVLDNLNPAILPAEERPDLIPVYSFNAAELWVNKQLDNGKQAGSAQQLSLWQQLMQKIRLEDEQFQQ